MKVISVVNTKGGSGKSTIACNIAAIAASEGKKVILIDADGKQQSSMIFHTFRTNYNEKLENEENKLAEYTAVSIPNNTIFKSIPSFNDFDLVVIDAGAGDNAIVRSAISASAYGILVIPCQPSPYDLNGTMDTLNLLEEARAMMDIKAFLVLNMIFTNKRVNILKDVEESINELIESYDVEIIEPGLTNYLAYKNSVMNGMSVVEFDAKGKAAINMMDFYNKIMKHLETEG